MTKTTTIKGTITDGPHLREIDVTVHYNNNELGETISLSIDDKHVLSVPAMDLRNIIS